MLLPSLVRQIVGFDLNCGHCDVISSFGNADTALGVSWLREWRQRGSGWPMGVQGWVPSLTEVIFFPHSVFSISSPSFSISLLSYFFPFIFLLSSSPDPTPFSERHRQGWLELHDVRLFICKPQHPECQDYRPSATMYWLCDLLLIEACLVCFFLTLEYRWSRSAISKRFLFWSLMVLRHSKPRRGWGGLSLPKIFICEGSLGESEKNIC